MRAYVLILAGCTWAYGVDPVKQAQMDAPADVDYCSLHPGDPLFHDEDGDGIEDVCDNCPGVANSDQADTLEVANGHTADGIGDACDPAPTRGGDRRVRFLPFADPSEGLEWSLQSGDWRIAEDSQLYTAVTFNGYGTTVFEPTIPAPPVQVVTRVTIDANLDATMTDTNFGLYVAGFLGTGCYLAHVVDAGTMQYDDKLYAMTNQGNGSYQGVPLGGDVLQVGVSFVLRATVAPTEVSCNFDDGAGHVGAVQFLGTPLTEPLQLASNRWGVHVWYLELFDLAGEQ